MSKRDQTFTFRLSSEELAWLHEIALLRTKPGDDPNPAHELRKMLRRERGSLVRAGRLPAPAPQETTP